MFLEQHDAAVAHPPTVTVKQMMEILAVALAKGHGDAPVSVWLPGSHVDLSFNSGEPVVVNGEVMIRGSVRNDSALAEPMVRH